MSPEIGAARKIPQNSLADPTKEPSECGVWVKSYVCDPTRILRDGEAMKLNTKILDIQNTTPCTCDKCQRKTASGYKFAIGLVSSIPLEVQQSAKEATHLFAEYLRNSSWNYGGDCGNDAVIFLNTEHKLVYTATGIRIKKIIDDDCALKVYKASKDSFDGSKYYEGLNKMLGFYAVILANEKCEFRTGLNTGALAGIVLGFVVAILATFCLLWYCRQRSKKQRQKRYLQTSAAAIKRSDVSSPSSAQRLTSSKPRQPTPPQTDGGGGSDTESVNNQE
ncbi:uncharacterized protein LOC141902792 [Tubulanus polymorphus]|uniref:uncharacterized protein LOC141902792 n=1 Tax=Tubulanus polymorphus TaxID=672921 RepID=UPI003DA2D677